MILVGMDCRYMNTYWYVCTVDTGHEDILVGMHTVDTGHDTGRYMDCRYMKTYW
jgi:hypothetical protein